MMIADLSVEKTLLSMRGNVWSFLNAICTKDIIKFQQQSNQQSIRGFLLNSKGRIVTDLLISKPPNMVDELWIEVSEAVLDNFQDVAERLNFRKSVQISPLKETKVFGMLEAKREIESWKNSDFIFPHPNGLGHRIYTTNTGGDVNLPLSEWNRQRILQYGIPESPHDILTGSSFPLEANGDLLQMIDMQKGCYIGQELTARTMIAQIARKRLIPYSSHKLVQPNSVVLRDGQPAGKIISSYSSLIQEECFGFALLGQFPNMFEGKYAVDSRQLILHRPPYLNKNN